MGKKYRVEVSIRTYTDGTLDQDHTLAEESADIDTHTHKAFALNAAVIGAVTNALGDMAEVAKKAHKR